MTAILAIRAPNGAAGDTAAGRNGREQCGPETLQWKRTSMTRLVEAVVTFAAMASFIVALVVMAGECLGDATMTFMADTMAGTARVAMPHVAEVSATATAPDTRESTDLDDRKS